MQQVLVCVHTHTQTHTLPRLPFIQKTEQQPIQHDLASIWHPTGSSREAEVPAACGGEGNGGLEGVDTACSCGMRAHTAPPPRVQGQHGSRVACAAASWNRLEEAPAAVLLNLRFYL